MANSHFIKLRIEPAMRTGSASIISQDLMALTTERPPTKLSEIAYDPLQRVSTICKVHTELPLQGTPPIPRPQRLPSRCPFPDGDMCAGIQN